MVEFPLHYASFKVWQFHNKSRSFWLGGWWWSLGVLGIKRGWEKRVLTFRTSECTLCICSVWYFVWESSRGSGLHQTNPWEKVYLQHLQQEILWDLLSHHVLKSSRSFDARHFGGFRIMWGWSESVRMELVVLPTPSMETHEWSDPISS
jgi:hypothetical protein